MATITNHNVGVKAMAACVPSEVVYNKDLTHLMTQEEVDKMINSVGIHERRISPVDVCASDLCYKAALKLMEDNQIDPESIDMLLFMSQSPDFKSPATACILQHRLGLSKSTACMDLTLACSGYVYALSTAFAYASMEGVNRILLLDGETFTKYVNPRDKVNVPLYGDSGRDALIVPDGGCRNPFTVESSIEKECENGNYRSDIQVYMDGMDVFNFAIGVVPKGVKTILKEVGITINDLDYLLFHQSNKFMTNFFVKRLKFDSDKVPYSIQKYGNTSSASIPLTICSELSGTLISNKKVVMCGFGAGLSWGTAFIPFGDCCISPVFDY